MQARVKIVTIRNKPKYGGCIFTARIVNTDGDYVHGSDYVVCVASNAATQGLDLQIGQTLNIAGTATSRVQTSNGYRIKENQVDAVSIELVIPSGSQIIDYLIENPVFKGIGPVKANKLWTIFNTNLVSMIEAKNHEVLKRVLTVVEADTLINEWAKLQLGPTLRWLQDKTIPIELSRKLIDYYGGDVQAKVEEDPYRLLSFNSDWTTTDAMALSIFKIAPLSNVRMAAALCESLQCVFLKGSTKVKLPMLYTELQRLLGSNTVKLNWKTQIDRLVSNNVANRVFIKEGAFLCPTGPYMMEKTIALNIQNRLLQTIQVAPQPDMNNLIVSYEEQHKFQLNDAQKDALHMANKNMFSMIVGGAGTGKTTVLDLICSMYKAQSFDIIQAAISARAAKKMQASSNIQALTVASVLYQAKKISANKNAVLIIDESSMLDLVSMYRLCLLLPKHVRILLIGDTGQLMPIGPGLILHALEGLEGIPQVKLTTANRFGSEIATAANMVRNGVWPTFSSDIKDKVVFLERDELDIADTVSELFAADSENVQLLSSVRKGMAGTEIINSKCQATIGQGREQMKYWSSLHNTNVESRYTAGSYILCNKNMWNFELQNGSQGKITKILQDSQVIVDEYGNETDAILGYAIWDDNIERALYESMLVSMELGAAMSVHKAQGSQWPRIIIALTGNPVLDRTLIYTAMTRACEQVIFVGDMGAAKRAVLNPPKHAKRLVSLREFLT